jgi:hypothetical protein
MTTNWLPSIAYGYHSLVHQYTCNVVVSIMDKISFTYNISYHTAKHTHSIHTHSTGAYIIRNSDMGAVTISKFSLTLRTSHAFISQLTYGMPTVVNTRPYF